MAREQEKWNKVRLEKPSMVMVYRMLYNYEHSLPRKVAMNTRPATDSAGGHSMLLQYKVIRVTHLMMTKATMGPQWNTLIRLVEDIVVDSSLFPSFIFLCLLYPSMHN